MSNPAPVDYDHLGIAEAIKRNRLVVPLHQREYSWTDKEVRALYTDLADAIQAANSNYFLGTIVGTRQEDGSVQIVDGQQRLSTTTILLAAIRDYFVSVNDELLVTSLEEFLFTIVRQTRERAPRLTLNVDDNEYFKRRVLLRPSDRQRKSVKPQRPSHDLIDAAAKIAAQHVQEAIQTYSPKNKIEWLNTWVSFLESSAQVIFAIATDDQNAFVMFETLNDRGLRTSQADLLKNYLFSQAGTRIKEAQHRWSSMRGTIDALEDDRDVTLTYLRHVTISRFGYTREREVLERIKEKVKRQTQAIQFLDELARSAIDYVAIQSPEATVWNGYPGNIREHVRTLSGTLQVTPLRPLMLSVLQNFSKSEAAKTFRQLVCWSTRYLVFGGLRSGSVEEGFANAAMMISSGHIKTLEKLRESLLKVLPTDAEFKGAFSTKRVSQAGLARYFLRALELKRKSSPEPEWVPNDDIVINLEHVLPVNPGVGWDHFAPETVPAYHNRLGNLALLQASKNATVGNEPFSTKKKSYKDSTFILTKELSEYPKWGPAEIDARQARMAELAVKTWPF